MQRPILELSIAYQVYLENAGVRMCSIADHNSCVPTREDALGHAHEMCEQIRDFIAKGDQEKAVVWFGFLQGILWSFGFRTLGDLKGDSSPTVS